MNTKNIIAIMLGVHAASASTRCLQQWCDKSCLVTLEDTYTCHNQKYIDDTIIPNSGGCAIINSLAAGVMGGSLQQDPSVKTASCVEDNSKTCPDGYVKEYGDGTTCRKMTASYFNCSELRTAYKAKVAAGTCDCP